MKIRITGTRNECLLASHYYKNLLNAESVSVSKLYPNRNSKNVYRVYVDVEYVREYIDSVDLLVQRGKI